MIALVKAALTSLVIFFVAINIPAIARTGWRGDAIISEPSSVIVTADNQVVDVSTVTNMSIDSDDPAVVNRDFTLRCGTSGQIVILCFVGSGGNKARLVDNAVLDGACGGAALLSANWSPATNSCIGLVNDGVNYKEFSRSNN